MKTTTLSLLGLLALGTPALAQSQLERAKDAKNDAKRELKHGAHKIDEELCTGTRAECAGKKVKHRATEAKDAVEDKASEVKDAVDSDKR